MLQKPDTLQPDGPLDLYADFMSQGDTQDFKWQGWLNGAKSQDPKKTLGLPAKPKKIPGPKTNPHKIRCRFCGP